MKTYSKVSRSTRLNEHSHKMVKDDIKRDNDSYSYPDHTEANAEALTKDFGDDHEEDFRVAIK